MSSLQNIFDDYDLQQLKKKYRETYVRILENENRRGFTTTKEKNQLEKLRKQIMEGENNAKL
jgi:hypothetical protein